MCKILLWFELFLSYEPAKSLPVFKVAYGTNNFKIVKIFKWIIRIIFFNWPWNFFVEF